MRLVVFRIENEEAATALADPLHQTPVAGAAQQRLDAIQWIDRAAASAVVRLRPFVDHRKRKTQFGGDLLGAALLENLAQKFVRLHGIRWKTPMKLARRINLPNDFS